MSAPTAFYPDGYFDWPEEDPITSSLRQENVEARARRKRLIVEECQSIDAALRAGVGSVHDPVFLAGLGAWIGNLLRNQPIDLVQDWYFCLGENLFHE